MDQGSGWGKVCSVCREKVSQQKDIEHFSFEKSPEFVLSPLCLQCSLRIISGKKAKLFTNSFKMFLRTVLRNFYKYAHDIPNLNLIIHIFLTIFFLTYVYLFTLILWNNLILSDFFQ